MGGGGGGGRFGGTHGSSTKISNQKMYQDGKHYNKHGKDMGYTSKKEYDIAAKGFAIKNQSNPDAKIYDGIWNGKGALHGQIQRIIAYDNKAVIINSRTGQIIDFYEGMDYRGFINLIQIR